jgi:hypothetical protein
MSSFLYDLRYLQAAVDVLQDFLFSPEIYWPIGIQPPAGETPYPQLTLGGISLALVRTEARAHSAEEKAQVADVRSKISPVYQQWRTAWGKKAALEIRGRITQWGNFLIDYQDKPGSNIGRFRYEVFRRVIITLLSPDALDLTAADQDKIAGLDKQLKSNFVPGPFIWEADLEGAFQPGEYWFLYGRLSQKMNPD